MVLGSRLTIRITRLRALLLSVTHLNVHRWRSPQYLDNEAIKRRADANPHNSLLVDDVVSNGPSTGPPHSYSVNFFVAMTHPKVPCWSWRPPSDAIINLSFDRNALQICRSVAFC